MYFVVSSKSLTVTVDTIHCLQIYLDVENWWGTISFFKTMFNIGIKGITIFKGFFFPFYVAGYQIPDLITEILTEVGLPIPVLTVERRSRSQVN